MEERSIVGRQRLLAEIDRQGGLRLEMFGLGPRRVPVVPYEIFFDGNTDDGSIAANLLSHPGAARFSDLLDGVAARDDVSGIFVGISEVMPTPDEGRPKEIVHSGAWFRRQRLADYVSPPSSCAEYFPTLDRLAF